VGPFPAVEPGAAVLLAFGLGAVVLRPGVDDFVAVLLVWLLNGMIKMLAGVGVNPNDGLPLTAPSRTLSLKTE
jgi:hypothetical protein